MTRTTRIKGEHGETVAVERAEGRLAALAWIRIVDGDGDAAAAYLTTDAATQLRDALDRLLRPKGKR